MARVVEFPSESGGVVAVEVTTSTGRDGPVMRGMRDNTVTERAQLTFEQAVGRVQPVAEALVSRLRATSRPPDELTVSFGLQLSAEAGAVIAAASTTANFSVSLTWRAAAEVPDPATGLAESSVGS